MRKNNSDPDSRGPLYHFFEKPAFDCCFLTGQPVASHDRVSVFPEWLMDRYELHGQWMGMLNWNRMKYGDMFIPCSAEAAENISILEASVHEAFEGGYSMVKNLDPARLFLWMNKILLGILYQDIQYSMDLAGKRNKTFALSPLLRRKFTDAHFMLQSLVRPLIWSRQPYSILIKEVNYSKDVFNFRDELKNLNFSLSMNGFGIVACLQDRSQNLQYHQSLIEKMGTARLHAIQFEELCARFIYSNYLLRQDNGWKVLHNEEGIIMSPQEEKAHPEFDVWDDKMYASVLADYFKPWGLEPKDIYTFPDSPVSFLIDEISNEFIPAEEIGLPS